MGMDDQWLSMIVKSAKYLQFVLQSLIGVRSGIEERPYVTQ